MRTELSRIHISIRGRGKRIFFSRQVQNHPNTCTAPLVMFLFYFSGGKADGTRSLPITSHQVILRVSAAVLPVRHSSSWPPKRNILLYFTLLYSV